MEFISLAKTDPTYEWPEKINQWPAFKAKHKVWEDAAKHIREATASNFLLTSELKSLLTYNKLTFVSNNKLVFTDYY